MGNVWVDVFILNSTYGYISADRFTGTIHPTLGHGDKAGCASCFPGEGAPDDLAPGLSTGCLGFQQSFLHKRQSEGKHGLDTNIREGVPGLCLALDI